MTRNNGSRIFLTELMFSIFFFIIIAAICVQCFAKSYQMSEEADELTMAINRASNYAEIFYSDDGAGSFTYYYDEKWQRAASDEAKYRITGIVEDEMGNCSLRTTMSLRVTRIEDETEIYSLSLEKGLPLED